MAKHRCTTQLAKLSFNHSIGRTHSWRFSIFIKNISLGLWGSWEKNGWKKWRYGDDSIALTKYDMPRLLGWGACPECNKEICMYDPRAAPRYLYTSYMVSCTRGAMSRQADTRLRLSACPQRSRMSSMRALIKAALMVLTWNYRVPRRVWTKTEIKSTFWGSSTKVLGTNCLGAEREHRCSTQFSSATCTWFIPQSWSWQKFPGRDTRLHLPWWWLSCPKITPSYGNSQG